MKLLHRHDEQIEKIQELTAELEQSPAVKKMRGEQAAKNLQKRTDAAAKIEALMEKLESLVEVSDMETETLQKKLDKLTAAAEKTQKDISEKKARVSHTKAGLEGQIRAMKEILYSSYSPEIDKTIIFFRKKLDDLRKPGRISTQKVGGIRNLFSGKISGQVKSNLDAIESSLKYCQSCIKHLEKAKLQPALDVKDIEQLKTNTPKIDVYSVLESERVLPGLKTPDPQSLLPLDSAMDYKKRKIMEKVEKILEK